MKANSSWKKVVAISPVETPEMEAEGKQHDITKKSHNRNAQQSNSTKLKQRLSFKSPRKHNNKAKT